MRANQLIMGITGLIVISLLVFGALVAHRFVQETWTAPLGPPLALHSTPATTATPTAFALASPTPQAAISISTVTRSASTMIPAAGTPTPLPVTVCNGPPAMILLGIGSDQRSDAYTYGLSDVMRIIRVDFITPKVTVLEIPRDLWVEIPGIADQHGVTHGKLNQAYLYGNPGFGFYSGADRGPGLLALTLDHNLGLRVDHYAAINMQTFVRVVDAVGGIKITIDRHLDGNARDSNPPKPELIYTPGVHHLDGQRALTLARLRPNGTLERANQQNLVLCALRDTLLSPKTVTRIPKLVASFQNSVQTDLSPEQIGQLACLAPHINGNNLVFARLPAELFQNTRVADPVLQKNISILKADFTILSLYMDRFVAGSWPEIPLPLVSGAQTKTEVSSFCP